jgi:hypothetical protein
VRQLSTTHVHVACKVILVVDDNFLLASVLHSSLQQLLTCNSSAQREAGSTHPMSCRKLQGKQVPFILVNGTSVSVYDVPTKTLACMSPKDLMATAATGASELLAIELASQV